MAATSPTTSSAAAAPASPISKLLGNLPRHRAAPALDTNILAKPTDRSKATALYIATHDRCEPPENQIVTTDPANILLRQFHARAEARLKQKEAKRANSEANEEPRPKRGRAAQQLQQGGD